MHACSYQCSNGDGSPLIPSLSNTYIPIQTVHGVLISLEWSHVHLNHLSIVWFTEHKNPNS